MDIRRVLAGRPPDQPAPVWRGEGPFAVAEASAELEQFVSEALKALGLEAEGAPLLVRHGPGQRGLPAAPSAGNWRFTLELTDARRTMDGGLLLFVEEGSRVRGWRAETGMMTLWRGEDPDLTELAPGASDRIMLLGRARALEV